MKPKQSKQFRIQIVISLLLTIITGVILLKLSDIPFGTAFNVALISFTIFIVWFFFLLGFLLFRSKRKLVKPIGIIPVLIALSILLITLIIKFDYKILYFRSLTPSPTTDEWKEDFEFLKKNMIEKHPALFTLIDKNKFNAQFTESINKLPGMSETEISGELFKLTALPNDAHTFPFIMFPCFNLHTYPLQVYYFDDGLGITDAGRAYKDLIGYKIVKIGSETPEEIFQKYPLLLSAESSQGKKLRFTYVVLMTEWLYYHKLIDESFKLNLTVKKGNKEKTLTLDPIEFYPHFIWSSVLTVENDAPPVISNPRKDLYRYTFSDDSKILYIQFNQCVPQEGKETMDEMVERMKEEVKEKEVDRVIVDLRNNDGGQEMWYALYTFLRDTENINKRGKLFVLIGRRTFSSAVLFANLVQMNTEAIFIGEGTSQGPSFYAGPTFIELPHSELVIAVSTRKTFSGLPFDQRKSIKPDISVPYYLSDFNEGKDPVLEKAVSYSDTIKQKSYSIDQPNKYTGRYLYNPLLVMDIIYDNDKLLASFSDFLPQGLVGFRSVLFPDSSNKFISNSKEIQFEFKNLNDSVYDLLYCYFYSDTIKMIRASNSYKTAFEYFSEDKYDEGCKIIKENSVSYKENISGLETMMNLLGYNLMREEQLESALNIFKLNTELYPESYNVYDSYGEALLKNGDTEKALKNYKKSVEINPNNENGKKVLKDHGVKME